MKLAEISHGRQGEADIEHLDTRIHQPADQRHFDAERIVTEIMSDGDNRVDPALMHERSQAFAQRTHAVEVQFRILFVAWNTEPPACIIYAKPRRLHERVRFERIAIGRDMGVRFAGHDGRLSMFEAHLQAKIYSLKKAYPKARSASVGIDVTGLCYAA